LTALAAPTYPSNDRLNPFRTGNARALAHPHFSTKERILSAAEALFARHGFAGASLRQVTAAANVNLAAVNYHFGSKDNLINEVFRRRLDELTLARLQALERARVDQSATLTTILEAFVLPALDLATDRLGGSAFMRVLARAYAEHDQSLRRFLSDNYGHVLKAFAAAIQELMPGLDKEALYWRLDFIAGALTYAMSDFGMVKRPPSRSEEEHRRVAARQFVRFAEAGLRAV
jgi:AcrR family transcriptional regulator